MRLYSQQKGPIDLNGLEILIRSGCRSEISAWPSHIKLTGNSQDKLILKTVNTDEELITDLEFSEVFDKPYKNLENVVWRLRRNTFDDKPATENGLTIFQRKDQETFSEAANRWLAAQILPQPDARVGEIEDLDTVLPMESVLLDPAGSDSEYRRHMIQSLLSIRSSSFAGLYEVPTSGWNWYAHTPVSQDINWVCTLEPLLWRPSLFQHSYLFC